MTLVCVCMAQETSDIICKRKEIVSNAESLKGTVYISDVRPLRRGNLH